MSAGRGLVDLRGFLIGGGKGQCCWITGPKSLSGGPKVLARSLRGVWWGVWSGSERTQSDDGGGEGWKQGEL